MNVSYLGNSDNNPIEDISLLIDSEEERIDPFTEEYINSNVKYIHNFNRYANYIPTVFENENTGHCIAYCVTADEMIFAVTFCKDQYVKALGRKYAIIRLLDQNARYHIAYDEFISSITNEDSDFSAILNIFSKRTLSMLDFNSFSSTFLREFLTVYIMEQCESNQLENVCKTKIEEESFESKCDNLSKSPKSIWTKIKHIFK
jgi:hypothetical protein